MRVNDAIIGAVLVIFAAAEIAYTRTFPSLHGQKYGPNLFPTLIGVGLITCGVILIGRGLLARRQALNTATEPAAARWVDLSNMAASSHARVNLALTVFFVVVYILFSEQIGFIPLSVITIGVLLYRLGSSLVAAALIAIVTTSVIQLMFAKVLLVPLPSGLLQGVFQ